MAEEDVIFGKNKHIYGGIEPNFLSNITVEAVDNVLMLTVVLDGDLVIEDQTLCTVGGAWIRRKETGLPQNEFDGELIADIKESGTYTDATADISKTYYYAVFMYSTRQVFNPFPAAGYGYNAPDFIGELTATAASESPDPEPDLDNKSDVVTLEIDIPSNAQGAIVVANKKWFPRNPSDGDIVWDCENLGYDSDSFSSRTEIVYPFTDIEADEMVYYRAFTYCYKSGSTTERVYAPYLEDYMFGNDCTYVILRKGNYFYGYDINLNDENPDTRVSYPIDVDNRDYSSGGLVGIDTNFLPGDWLIILEEAIFAKPCMLKYDGTVDYYLNQADYSKKADGTASDVANLDYEGNAMIEWGKIYTKRWNTTDSDGNTIYHFRCSDVKIDDDYECWCNYDKNGNVIDHFYTPIYNGCYDSAGRLRSISGQTYAMFKKATEDFAAAALNGDDYTIETLADRLLINDLLILISKTTDAQTAFGMGRSVSSSMIKTGTMDAKGLFCGNTTDGSVVIKVFGMENYWGEQWRRVAGLIVDNGVVKAKATRGVTDGTTVSDYNTTGEGYNTLYTLPDALTSGWLKTTTTTKYGRLPYAVGGSSSTYECDYFYLNKAGVVMPLAGGYLSDGSGSGPSYWMWDWHFTNSSFDTGGSALSCKPSATTT